MRVVLLCLPVPIMLLGAVWMLIVTTRTQGQGRLAKVRRAFTTMSYAVGMGFLLWSGLTLVLQIVNPAYPILMACVGLLIIGQGWAFDRFKLF